MNTTTLTFGNDSFTAEYSTYHTSDGPHFEVGNVYDHTGRTLSPNEVGALLDEIEVSILCDRYDAMMGDARYPAWVYGL
jgi:hypothetical protein